MIKNLTLFAIFGITMAIAVKAQEQEANAPLTLEQVQKMSCADAVRQLRDRIELNKQLGSASLQIYENLEDVYSTWGDRLAQQKELASVLEIGSFFKRNAATVKDGRIKSAVVIHRLAQDTDILMNRVAECAAR